MKKILSFLLVLCLFLTPVHALAEGTYTQVQISDINLAFSDLEDPISIGLSLLLTSLSGDKGASLSLAVNDAQANMLAWGGISMDANGLTALIDGIQTAYHLSYEALDGPYSEQVGMSFNQLGMLSNGSVTANNEELANPFSTFSERFTTLAELLTDICNEVLTEAEQTLIGIETVSVFDEEYELQRVDITVSAEDMQKICFAFLDEISALAAEYPDQFAIDQDMLTQLRDELDCPEVTYHYWYNEDRSVWRVEADLYTTSDEYIMTVVVESLNTEAEGQCFQVSFLDGSTTEEGFYFIIAPSGARQYGFYIDFFDASGNTEQSIKLFFGFEPYKDSNSVYAVLSYTDDSGTTELGCKYVYQDISEDPVEQYSGHMIIWYDIYDDQMVQTDSYSLGFTMDISHGSYDTDGTLSTEGVASIVEIDQMSDEDFQQAQAELNDFLQNFILEATADPGVRQLLMLFSGMFNSIESQNM